MEHLNKKDQQIWAEMARRYKQFHDGEPMDKIKLWGLFSWGIVRKQRLNGELITDMQKENKTIWVRPSKDAIEKYIKPLLKYDIKTLTQMAGWNTAN